MMRVRRNAVFPLVALLVAFCLLIIHLGEKSLWVDELFTAELTYHSFGEIVADVGQDLHPPLYFWAIRSWSALAGTSEVALRLPSVLVALLGLWLTWRLGIRIVGRQAADVGLAVLACSPLFIEFSRMARYYTWVLTLGVLATLWLVDALERGHWRSWLAYSVAVALGLFTSYLSATLVLAHGLAVVLGRRWGPAQKRNWLVSMVGVGLAFTPWLAVVLGQIHRAGVGSADYSRSIVGLVAAVTYPFYAFSVGETLFPWFPLAAPAALVVLGLVAWGVIRASKAWGALLAAAIIVPIGLMSLVTTFVSTGTPFLDVPVRALFVLPFLALAAGAGWQALPRRSLRLAVAALAVAAWGVGLANYFTGQQYLNPIYVVPARQVAGTVAAQADTSDVVIGEADSAFSYYFRRTGSPVRYFETTEADKAVDYLSTHPVRQVWLVTMGRDGTRELVPVELIRWLEANRRLLWEQGYVEQDPLYRRVKERLLHRPAYQYKLLVQRYGSTP
jgi:uncharacterized membrane protein